VCNDPDWSKNEWNIVEYLRTKAGYRVGPGGETPNRRLYDFTIDGEPGEGKTLDPGSDSGTMRNRAADSCRDGGQAPLLIFDVRVSGMSMTEARRGVRRIAGLYGISGLHGHRLARIIVIGDDFYLEEGI